MNFNQNEKTGKCVIYFSWKERIFLFFTGKLKITDIGSRHLGNHLMRMVISWQEKFNKDVKDLTTYENTPVDTE